MKKWLAAAIAALFIFGAAATPVQSIEYVSHEIDKQTDKATITIVLDTFTVEDFADLMVFTGWLRDGDTLKIYTIGPGGNAFVLSAMLNYIDKLKTKGVHIITEVGGSAFSANAMIFLAGDERIVYKNDIVMVHGVVFRGSFGPISWENLTPGQKKIKRTLDNKMRQMLLDITRDVEFVNKVFKEDVWLDGDEAFALGIATTLKK